MVYWQSEQRALWAACNSSVKKWWMLLQSSTRSRSLLVIVQPDDFVYHSASCAAADIKYRNPASSWHPISCIRFRINMWKLLANDWPEMNELFWNTLYAAVFVNARTHVTIKISFARTYHVTIKVHSFVSDDYQDPRRHNLLDCRIIWAVCKSRSLQGAQLILKLP
jgi:hypothetical protein